MRPWESFYNNHCTGIASTRTPNLFVWFNACGSHLWSLAEFQYRTVEKGCVIWYGRKNKILCRVGNDFSTPFVFFYSLCQSHILSVWQVLYAEWKWKTNNAGPYNLMPPILLFCLQFKQWKLKLILSLFQKPEYREPIPIHSNAI